jgi:hypothetical protein
MTGYDPPNDDWLLCRWDGSELAQFYGAHFFDVGPVVRTEGIDSLHLGEETTEAGHRAALGSAEDRCPITSPFLGR